MFGFIMAVGHIVSSLNENRISQLWPANRNFVFHAPCPGIAFALFTPPQIPTNRFIAHSPDDNFLLALNGYIISDAPVSGLENHLAIMAKSFQTNGLANGMAKLSAGSFNLAVIDKAAKSCRIYSDPGGSTPLYYSRVDDGWLLSNNPVALINSGLINPTIDPIGAAEWALFSHTIGNRYPIKEIKTCRVAEYFQWDGREGRFGCYDRLWDKLPLDKTPGVSAIAEEFTAACGRIRLIDDNPAQLQSAGMDSRLITAAWPDSNRPDCYTYGNPEAHEIPIARQIAETKGAGWTHVWQHGDEVARYLDTMFDNTGIIIWPDRYFAGKKMSEDGHIGTLDGFAGDSLLGGSDYNFGRYFGSNRLYKSLLCQFTDYNYNNVGLDAIAETLYQKQLQIPNFDNLREYLADDFVDSIAVTKNDILSDIRKEIDHVLPPNDSLALLWRNFIYANRAPHMTIQQGLMCNNFVMVYYPFINDMKFHDLAFRFRPEDVAFRRLYIKLYRACYPAFADIPYGATLLPIRRPTWNHKLAAIMVSQGRSIPILTASTKGKPRDPNSWSIWMRQSETMRGYIYDNLVQSGIANSDRCTKLLSNIASGATLGGGKIFHMVSIAKWHSLIGAPAAAVPSPVAPPTFPPSS